MINNCDKILPLFFFDKGDQLFYHLQIIQRNKDLPERRDLEHTIKMYLVRSQAHLQALMPEIILLCEHYGARAYINPMAKHLSDLQLEMLSNLAGLVKDKCVSDGLNILSSSAATVRAVQKIWVVDIDKKKQLGEVKDWLYKWFLAEYKKGPATKMPKEYFAEQSIITTVPTKSGYHLLTRPFNKAEFREVFPDVSIHDKSAGTLLYYPSSLDTYGTPEGSSAEAWVKWFRDGFGLALNIIAHDGDFYTWEPVYLKKYSHEPLPQDNVKYSSYEVAMAAAVRAACKHLKM